MTQIPGYHDNIPMAPPQMMGWHPNDPSAFYPMEIPATPQNSPVKGKVLFQISLISYQRRVTQIELHFR